MIKVQGRLERGDMDIWKDEKCERSCTGYEIGG